MKIRSLLPFLTLAIVLLMVNIPYSLGSSSGGEEMQHQSGHGDKEKRKSKRKRKKALQKSKNSRSKKNKSKSGKKNKKVDSAKAKKQKDKRDKKHQKNLDKVNKQKAKEKKKVAKAQSDRPDYTKCDSADVVRTSQDTLLLRKYMTIYRSLGGICYIIHLQQMADLLKTSDGFYSVRIHPSKDPRAPADWQTYLYCPIGKPTGTVALIDPLGDTIQLASYANEKKEGMMIWVKKGEGVIHREKYTNDNKVWADDPSQGQ